MKPFKIISIVIFAVFVSLYSCAQDAKPIAYNSDNCALCKMQISDARFGAELISDKGKIFTFDSAECMFRYLKKNKETSFSKILVTDYNQPNQLIDATHALFLISENLPSPMGADLSAYGTTKEAEMSMKKNGGVLYSFDEVQNEL